MFSALLLRHPLRNAPHQIFTASLVRTLLVGDFMGDDRQWRTLSPNLFERGASAYTNLRIHILGKLSKVMLVNCWQELFEKFPEASIHGVVFDRLDLITEEIAHPWKLQAIRSVLESGITSENVVESPPIREWRGAFQSFGLKPSKYRSSIEQLYRRALKGEIIQTPLPLVNLYCYVSIINQAPMGACDLSKVSGDIVVRYAGAGEEFTAIGETQSIKSEAGVVVYADEAGIICWGWNHRDCARTALNHETQKAIFFVDSAIQESRFRAEEAIRSLSEILSSSGCLRVGSFVLDSRSSEALLRSSVPEALHKQ